MAHVRTHKEGVDRLRQIIWDAGLTYYVKSKYRFAYFIPDLEINVGGLRKDTVIIDFVNTKGSFNRVLGGFYALKRFTKEIRHFLIVVNDNIYYNFRSLAKSESDILIIPLSSFENWLRNEIIECASARARPLLSSNN